MSSPVRGRLLAVDFGESRVGLALSDSLGFTAQPLDTLTRQSDQQVCLEIAAIVGEREVVEVILGLPLELSGREGPSAKRVRRFARKLEDHLEVPIGFFDERLTSIAAERSLAEDGMRWRKRKRVVDQVAASLLLQTVLDSRR